MANWQRRRPLPADWPTRRRRVMRRDRGVCHWCGNPGADEVDHVDPNGGHELTNLAPIHCIPCHQDKTITERPLRRYHTQTRPPDPHPGLR